jgi:hypothetical protein
MAYATGGFLWLDCIQAHRLVAAVCQTADGLGLVVPLENGRAGIHNVQGGGTPTLLPPTSFFFP